MFILANIRNMFLFAILASAPVGAVVTTATPWTVSGDETGAIVRLSFNGIIDGQVASGLGAQMVLRLAEVSADSRNWTFDIVRLSNMSEPAPMTSRVSTFGFNVFDDTAATFRGAAASGSYPFVSLNASPPQLDDRFSVCFRSSSSGSCNGGASGGVWQDDEGQGRFSLNLSAAVGHVTLDNFFVRYQAISGVSGVANGSSGIGVAVLLEPIPEPGTWVLLIAGFGLVGAAMRRRRAYSTQSTYSTQSSPLSR